MRYTVDEYLELRKIAQTISSNDNSFSDIIDDLHPWIGEKLYRKWLRTTTEFKESKELYRVLYGSYKKLPLLINDIKYIYAQKILNWRLALGK